jgi:hypothetical protein
MLKEYIESGICPVCGSSDVKNQGVYRYQNPIFANASRLTCMTCQMIFASPMPSDEDLAIYNASYFETAHGGLTKSPIEKSFFQGIASLRLSYVKKYLERHNIKCKRVFELGPGPGYLAKCWLEQDPQIIYSAVETDRASHKYLEHLGVKLISSSDKVQSDIVVMSHVLEHVSNPVEFIKEATEGLIPEGILFIEVPCQDWAHKELDEPHILFFDKNPMRQMLENIGFTNIELSYFGPTIRQLKSKSKIQTFVMRVRAKLIRLGFIAPFSIEKKGMDGINDPLTRAVISPFKAHIESNEPAWWLRVIARKV